MGLVRKPTAAADAPVVAFQMGLGKDKLLLSEADVVQPFFDACVIAEGQVVWEIGEAFVGFVDDLPSALLSVAPACKMGLADRSNYKRAVIVRKVVWARRSRTRGVWIGRRSESPTFASGAQTRERTLFLGTKPSPPKRHPR